MKTRKVSRNKLSLPDLKKPPAQILILFSAALVISVVFYLVLGADTAKRTFFFPKVVSSDQTEDQRMEGEVRYLPKRKGLEGNVSLLVDDLILGPMEPDHARLVNAQTRLLSVSIHRGMAYLSFSLDLVEENGEALPVPDQLQLIANTVIYNFPQVYKLYILIEGQIPVFQHTVSDFSQGLTFAPKLF